MKKALITGIAGQDGSLLAKFLLGKGYAVTGILRPPGNTDLYRLQFLGILDRLSLEPVNLLDAAAVRGLIERTVPDEIYHLAAQSSVGLSFEQPSVTVAGNMLSTLSLLEAVRQSGVQARFYHASSSEMFGNIRETQLPLREHDVFNPVSPYAVSKAAAHWLCRVYRDSYGIPACNGILFNHESALRGSMYVTKKIVQTVLAIREGRADRLELGDIEIERDWGYAPEYVRAMWLMLQAETVSDYLICSGSHCSLRELAGEIFLAAGLSASTHLVSNPDLYRPVELRRIYGDNSKARAELGWDYRMTVRELAHSLVQDELELQEWLQKAEK